MPRLLPVILVVALVVYALIDCVRTPRSAVPVTTKGLWVAVILLLPAVGAILWLVLSRVARAGGRRPPGPTPWGPPGQRPPTRPGPVGPDDDPAFLARIEAERRRSRRKRSADGSAAGRVEPPVAPPPQGRPASPPPEQPAEPEAPEGGPDDGDDAGARRSA